MKQVGGRAMGNSLMFSLKRWHLSSMRAHYERTQIIRLPDGDEQEVTVFSGENCIFLAQYTPLGTIAIHECVLENKMLLNYVLAHENAHKKQWWSFFRISLAGLAIFYAPGLYDRAFESLFYAVFKQDWQEAAYFPLFLIAATAFIFIPVAFSWLTEIDADFRAIRAVGINTFLDLHRSSHNPLKFGFNNVINLITHPPLSVTVGLWQKFHHKADVQHH
jgi:hypothetical protein